LPLRKERYKDRKRAKKVKGTRINKMNDRLGELRKKRASTNQETIIGLGITNSEDIDIEEIENGVEKEKEKENFMETFFQDIDSVKAELSAIKDAIKKIHRIHQDALEATTSSAEEQLSHALDLILADTSPRSQYIKATLDRMSKETKEYEESGRRVKQSEVRIRKNLITTLQKKLVDIMSEYQVSSLLIICIYYYHYIHIYYYYFKCIYVRIYYYTCIYLTLFYILYYYFDYNYCCFIIRKVAQDKYRSFIKKKIARQVKIVQPDISQEDLDNITENADNADGVIKMAMEKRANRNVVAAYNEALDKYKDVRKIETSLKEISEMMNDFVLLVGEQGELLDSISEHVKQAGEFVEQGNKQLEGAIKSQKETRKYQCCFIVFVLIIIAIIVLMIFVF